MTFFGDTTIPSLMSEWRWGHSGGLSSCMMALYKEKTCTPRQTLIEGRGREGTGRRWPCANQRQSFRMACTGTSLHLELLPSSSVKQWTAIVWAPHLPCSIPSSPGKLTRSVTSFYNTRFPVPPSCLHFELTCPKLCIYDNVRFPSFISISGGFLFIISSLLFLLYIHT